MPTLPPRPTSCARMWTPFGARTPTWWAVPSRRWVRGRSARRWRWRSRLRSAWATPSSATAGASSGPTPSPSRRIGATSSTASAPSRRSTAARTTNSITACAVPAGPPSPPRRSYGELTRQYFGYGQAKVVVLSRHPKQTRLRQLVPAGFVLALLGAAIAALFGGMLVLPLAVLAGAYVTASLSASVVVARRQGWRHVLRLPLAFACMHLAYGLGFLTGLVRRTLGQPVARPKEAEGPGATPAA